MIEITYKPHGVCARAINLRMDDDASTVLSCSFTGGCDGNLKAISKLVAGMSAERVVSLLRGNTCGHKGTSCADQLCAAIDEAAARARA